MALEPDDCLRDVSLSLAPFLEDGKPPVPAGVLWRGPLLKSAKPEQLGAFPTIVNLRMEPDEPQWLPGHAKLVHCPLGNKTYAYDTRSGEVRSWLVGVFSQLEGPLHLPLLIHCKHGRDRTGVVVAVLLLALGANPAAVMQEFLKTQGAKERHLRLALDGIREAGGVDAFFAGAVDLDAVRDQLCFARARAGCRERYRAALGALGGGAEAAAASCEELLGACRRALRLDQNDPEVLAAAGWALSRLCRLQEARRSFEAGLLAVGRYESPKGLVLMMERELAQLGGG